MGKHDEIQSKAAAGKSIQIISSRLNLIMLISGVLFRFRPQVQVGGVNTQKLMGSKSTLKKRIRNIPERRKNLRWKESTKRPMVEKLKLSHSAG